jgi:cytochrome c oxidase assembly factor CtaG
VAFISPLNALSTALFSAHMGQHLLLIFVAAPLLVWGMPLIAWLWLLPPLLRHEAGRGWNQLPLLQATWRGLTHPLLVWFLWAGALWLWHTPRLYQAALKNSFMHELEHFSFLGAACLFWWLVLQPGGHRRLEYGVGVLFVFTTALQSGALGALITFAPTPLYPVYTSTALAWHLTPLEDQQLAGLMMWIPGSLIYVLTALSLFLTWLKIIEQKVLDQPVFKPG